MHTRICVAVTAALLTLASTAHAAVANGTVESYDPEQRLLVLENGTPFAISPRIQEMDVEPGDQVQIVWNGYRVGIRLANQVTVVGEAED